MGDGRVTHPGFHPSMQIDNKKVCEAAKKYLRMGWSVVPTNITTVVENEEMKKKPYFKNGTWIQYRTERMKEEDVEKEWKGFPHLSIVTGKISGITVVDVDTKKPVLPYDFPETFLVESNHGYHYYFKYNPDVAQTQKEVPEMPIHFRNDGGLIFAPPSEYELPKGFYPNQTHSEYKILRDLPLAEFPMKWYKDTFGAKTNEEGFIIKHTPEDWEEMSKGVNDGCRNNTAIGMAGKLISQFKPAEHKVAWELFKAWNESNRPRLDNENIKKKWEGAMKMDIGNHPDRYQASVPGSVKKEDIELPKSGKLISEFINDIVGILKTENILFYRNDLRQVVEVGDVKHNSNENEEHVFTGFLQVKPSRFITLVEKYFNPGHMIYDNKLEKFFFKTKSMSKDLCNTILESPIIESTLENIYRIFTIPVPIIYEKELTFPKIGYDDRFNSWLPMNAPEINPDMELEEAKTVIENVLKEFCFQEDEDKTIAIAGLITPFLRGLYSKNNARTPIIIYLGNRERVGKDYLAGITGIIYEGVALEEPPISVTRNKGDADNELRKKILSALIQGRKRLHFSNNKGYIDNGVLEGVITATTYSDRLLGQNKMLVFNNELEFSFSGNIGITFTPDLANRARICRLFYSKEDANARVFSNPDLHKLIGDNRGRVLSAIYSLVLNWVKEGKPDGKVKFASFPEWARVCGGVMETAGYESPCEASSYELSTETPETIEMKQLYELCYKEAPDTLLNKKDIRDLVAPDEDIFEYYDFTSKKDQGFFGKKLKKYIGRELSGILFKPIDTDGLKESRHRYMFTKKIVKKG